MRTARASAAYCEPSAQRGAPHAGEIVALGLLAPLVRPEGAIGSLIAAVALGIGTRGATVRPARRLLAAVPLLGPAPDPASQPRFHRPRRRVDDDGQVAPRQSHLRRRPAPRRLRRQRPPPLHEHPRRRRLDRCLPAGARLPADPPRRDRPPVRGVAASRAHPRRLRRPGGAGHAPSMHLPELPLEPRPLHLALRRRLVRPPRLPRPGGGRSRSPRPPLASPSSRRSSPAPSLGRSPSSSPGRSTTSPSRPTPSPGSRSSSGAGRRRTSLRTRASASTTPARSPISAAIRRSTS